VDRQRSLDPCLGRAKLVGMRERATLKLDRGDELRVELDTDELR
jgi:hypothetical protein